MIQFAKGAAGASTSQTLEAALEYANRGWQVLPLHAPLEKDTDRCSCGNPNCKSVGKHPRIGGGFKSASHDPTEIEGWFTKWPEANVGIATVEDLLVLDVDPRNGGDDSLRELAELHGRIETRTIRTGSGGRHFYFRVDRPIRGRTGVRPGLDLKAGSGYVVAPPSRHPQGTYEVIDDRDPAPAPEWLLDLARDTANGPMAEVLSAAQLASLAAPSEDLATRTRWTRHVVAAIKNDERFQRQEWIGIAHAIRASCGEGGESEAFEIFDEFSQRWEGGYDAEETRRVWDSLPPSTSTNGYRRLLDLALRDGYELPEDHPERPENEFEAALDVVTPEAATGLQSVVHLADQISIKRPHNLLRGLREAFGLLSGLTGIERAVGNSYVSSRLEREVGRQHARSILKAVAPPTERDAFVIDRKGRTSLRALTAADLTAGDAYLVKGRIPRASVGAVVANFSMGKTWLMIDLGCSIAFGEPWLRTATVEGPVIFLVAEGTLGFPARIHGWMHAHGLLPQQVTPEDIFAALEGRVIISRYPPRLDDPDFEEQLAEIISNSGAVAVFIDTLGKSLGPEQAEADNDVANGVTAMFSRASSKTGATIMFSHHTPYGQKRARGASGWEQGLDFSYLLDGSQRGFADGQPISLEPRKMRDGEWPKQVHLRLKKMPDLRIARDPEGSLFVGSAVLEMSDPPRPSAQDLPLETRVFLHVEDHPGCPKMDIQANVTGSNGSIQEAVQTLLARGAIENRGASNRHSYHVVDGWEGTGRGVDRPGKEFSARPDLSDLERDPEAQDAVGREDEEADNVAN